MGKCSFHFGKWRGGSSRLLALVTALAMENRAFTLGK
jgi:hypothetical protein